MSGVCLMFHASVSQWRCSADAAAQCVILQCECGKQKLDLLLLSCRGCL